ncbi:MAG TPA: sigma 54-interacting transcriptional regulator [Negativicutes bacterium]|nr:sigma 54-interacting transcriptional regulator [Negativicutes bacterium]
MGAIVLSHTAFNLDRRMRLAMDTPFEGILSFDESGDIFFVNNFFADMLGVTQPELLGRKVWDVLPGTSLFDTVVQGYSIWGDTLMINGHELLVARFPIKEDGKVVGAIVKTIFPDQTVGKEIANKIWHSSRMSQCQPQSLCTCQNIIGETEPMLYVKKLARRASRTSSTLLITGESGTGKEVIAQAIHTRSVRRERPFVSVNCAAIPENLLESELFGYVEGAFTGAKRGGKPGKFELADGGTILLDEIGDMPAYMQVKLLRVLQERVVWRVGATAPTPIDVRVMASTNQDLNQLVMQKKFRQDLYYRLNVLQIHMPPLRDRVEDLPMLLQGLILKINQRIGADARGVSPESLAIMQQYNWPGNVRELENLLEQAINWSADPIVDVRAIPNPPWQVASKSHPMSLNVSGLKGTIEEAEKSLIQNALMKASGNKAQAARVLNMQRSVLYKKLERYNLG